MKDAQPPENEELSASTEVGADDASFFEWIPRPAGLFMMVPIESGIALRFFDCDAVPGDAWCMTPAQARELAATLLTLAPKAEAMQRLKKGGAA